MVVALITLCVVLAQFIVVCLWFVVFWCWCFYVCCVEFVGLRIDVCVDAGLFYGLIVC